MNHAEPPLHERAPAGGVALDAYWMPFTPNREFKAEPRMVVRAEGVHYWNDRGERIIDAAPDGAIEFFHGYTYSGHPAACAAGLATLDIYEREGLFERARALSPRFLEAMFALADLPAVADIRGYGMLAAIEVHPDAAPGRRGNLLQKRLFDNGLHLKTTGDAAIVAPPLVATDAHIDEIADILRRTLRGI